MFIALIVVGSLAFAGGIFLGGKAYGQHLEAQAVSDYLKVKASSVDLYAKVVADVKADATRLVTKLKAKL